MRVKSLLVAIVATVVALASWSCDDAEVDTPVYKPTIGIMEPEFDASTMTVKVMIAPSTDATAWYWRVSGGHDTEDAAFTKVDGAVAQEISFVATYGTEYTIKAYAENKAGESDIAEKKFCAMPEGEVTLTIGEITLNAETQMAEATIYPSKAVTTWYWQSYATDEDRSTLDWTAVDGNAEKVVSFPYVWGKTIELRAYAECGDITSDEITAQCYFEPTKPTITVSKPQFDETSMTLSFEVTPSEDTDHWYWGENSDSEDAQYEHFDDAEKRIVSCTVEYNREYQFLFRAENVLNEGEQKIVDFTVISPVADIAIENLTAYTLDAVITKHDHCVRYVVGAVHTSAYDRNVFIEQAQSSLNPDPSYPFAVFNSATESCTFSEQDLVRNSRTDSNENAGITLTPGTSFTIAVYGEDAAGNYNVTTEEVVIPEAEINGTLPVSLEVVNITETSADISVTVAEECKVLIGYVDPEIARSDTDNPFDFEGKSDAEIMAYIARTAQGIPSIYSEPVTRTLSNYLEIDHEYYAYAIAIKGGKIGEVAFTTFKTTRPSLTGVAKITAATIEPQTSHESLTVVVTPDDNAEFVRIYAAPSADHAAYAENLEYVLDADDYQNYREEYEIVDGVATASIDIYHPGDNYYIYASAVDASGHAGEMVCVARMAGYDTDYYTTMEEVVAEGSLSYYGTGEATMNVEVISRKGDTINVILKATDFSDNVSNVWFMRFGNCLISGIESSVKQSLAEYATSGKVKGSYKAVTEDVEYRYENDLSNSFNPKYEGLLIYDDSYGGDIIVMVILDTAGKVNIHSYYAAGTSVVELP